MAKRHPLDDAVLLCRRMKGYRVNVHFCEEDGFTVQIIPPNFLPIFGRSQDLEEAVNFAIMATEEAAEIGPGHEAVETIRKLRNLGKAISVGDHP